MVLDTDRVSLRSATIICASLAVEIRRVYHATFKGARQCANLEHLIKFESKSTPLDYLSVSIRSYRQSGYSGCTFDARINSSKWRFFRRAFFVKLATWFTLKRFDESD